MECASVHDLGAVQPGVREDRVGLRRLTAGRSVAHRATACGPSEAGGGESAATPCWMAGQSVPREELYDALLEHDPQHSEYQSPGCRCCCDRHRAILEKKNSCDQTCKAANNETEWGIDEGRPLPLLRHGRPGRATVGRSTASRPSGPVLRSASEGGASGPGECEGGESAATPR